MSERRSKSAMIAAIATVAAGGYVLSVTLFMSLNKLFFGDFTISPTALACLFGFQLGCAVTEIHNYLASKDAP